MVDSLESALVAVTAILKHSKAANAGTGIGELGGFGPEQSFASITAGYAEFPNAAIRSRHQLIAVNVGTADLLPLSILIVVLCATCPSASRSAIFDSHVLHILTL